jgi:3,4-dihydroxy 2-butanone 4-phosphate synthase/GTP cyclohydrolase II
LTEKIKAYQLQDAGMDTIDANLHLGHEIDARDWSDAIAIVKALGIKELTLLTNNPHKIQALHAAGIEVTQVNLTVVPNSFNEKYLATKEEKLGHLRGGK